MKIKRNVDAKKIPYNIIKKIAFEIYEADQEKDKINEMFFNLSLKKNNEELVILLFNKHGILMDQYTYEIDILDKSITSIHFYPIKDMLNEEEFENLIESIDKYQKSLFRKSQKIEDKKNEFSIFDGL